MSLVTYFKATLKTSDLLIKVLTASRYSLPFREEHLCKLLAADNINQQELTSDPLPTFSPKRHYLQLANPSSHSTCKGKIISSL